MAKVLTLTGNEKQFQTFCKETFHIPEVKVKVSTKDNNVTIYIGDYKFTSVSRLTDFLVGISDQSRDNVRKGLNPFCKIVEKAKETKKLPAAPVVKGKPIDKVTTNKSKPSEDKKAAPRKRVVTDTKKKDLLDKLKNGKHQVEK